MDITLDPKYELMCGLTENDIQTALSNIFAGREGMSDEDKRKSVYFHHEEMPKC